MDVDANIELSPNDEFFVTYKVSNGTYDIYNDGDFEHQSDRSFYSTSNYPLYYPFGGGNITLRAWIESDDICLNNACVPEITSITDMPNDEGGFVFLFFNQSLLESENTNDLPRMNILYSIERYDPVEYNQSDSLWVSLQTEIGSGQEAYNYVISTLVDSTSENDGITQFRVIASGEGGTYISSTYSGYSVNNTLLSISDQLPKDFFLSDNYPNPFNPITNIKYTLPVISDLNITIYNIKGEIVSVLFNSAQTSGYHSVSWNGSEYASGVYFVKMVAGEFVQTQKLMFVK